MELRPDLWHCAECETAYAVGLTCCPQCSSQRRADAPEPATGGFISSAGSALVGERGPETILPVRKTPDEPEEM